MRPTAVLACVVAVSLSCEAPSEVVDRSVLLAAAWDAPVEEFEPLDTVPGFPAVRVTDSNGRPLQGVAVSFVLLTPPIWDYPLTATSDADGIAVMPAAWRVGYKPGIHQAAAFVPSGQNGPPVTFSVTVRAGPATQMTASIGTDSIVGFLDSVTVVLNLRDAFSNTAVAPVPPTLTSSDTTVLKVIAGNRIVGVSQGSALLRAVSATLRDSMTILVGAEEPALVHTAYPFYDGVSITIGANRIAYVTDVTTELRRFDIAALDSLPTFVTSIVGSDATLRNTAGEIWVKSHPHYGTVHVLSMTTGDSLNGIERTCERLMASRDESYVYCTGTGSATYFLTPGSPIVESGLATGGGEWTGVSIAAGDSVVYLSSPAGRVERVHAVTQAITARTGLGVIASIAADGDRNRVYVTRQAIGVSVLDATTLATLRTTASLGAPIDIAPTPDGRYLIVTGGDRLRVLDAVTLFQYANLSMPGSWRVAFDPLTSDAWIVRWGTSEISRIQLTTP